jgi:hypothetical protein
VPTNITEAKKIYDIVNDYVGFKSARELSKRLMVEVAEHTENNSLEESLRMLYNLYHSNLAQQMRPSLIDQATDCAAVHQED